MSHETDANFDAFLRWSEHCEEFIALIRRDQIHCDEQSLVPCVSEVCHSWEPYRTLETLDESDEEAEELEAYAFASLSLICKDVRKGPATFVYDLFNLKSAVACRISLLRSLIFCWGRWPAANCLTERSFEWNRLFDSSNFISCNLGCCRRASFGAGLEFIFDGENEGFDVVGDYEEHGVRKHFREALDLLVISARVKGADHLNRERIDLDRLRSNAELEQWIHWQMVQD